jgi:hypothetical protein
LIALVDVDRQRLCRASTPADRRETKVAGAKFETGVLVERPDEPASGDTHAA